MERKEEYMLDKCPRCGFESPVEHMEDKEGVLEVIHCAMCAHVYIQTPVGPPGTKPTLMTTDDKRRQRNAAVLGKIKKWWQEQQQQ